MRATYFGGMHIAISILLERAIILPKDKTGKNNSLVAASACFQVLDVIVCIWRVADYQQTISGAHLFESFNNESGIILRLKTRDIQNIAVWLCAPTAHGCAIGPAFNFRSISDHR